MLRALGLGLITGAADDDCSAIGTYATAGARFGPSFLWTAPVTFPMMVAVVYLSAKLGQVTGEGLFAALRRHYSRWVFWPALVAVLIGNTIEAGANIFGMAAALNLLIPLPVPVIIIATTGLILGLQIWGSYKLIRNIFRWLALTLLAYIPAAILAKPDVSTVIRGTLIPTIRFDREFLALLVAVVGTTLSAYLYTWQSNQEVEEEIELGRHRLHQRRGATDEELKHSWWDIVSGMFFSNVVMYFIILSTASTLFVAGRHEVESAADAARALQPLAGPASGVLFAAGIVGVGFLAVPVMTTGAAYDLCQVIGWKHGLSVHVRDAKPFYLTIVLFTVAAMSMGFTGINPMKALVFSGIVQGFSTPPLMLLIVLMTGSRRIMGDQANGWPLTILGWVTTVVIFATSLGLLITWLVTRRAAT